MVKPDSSINYYATLNVDINATNDEIKKQYRRLALLHHPDRNPDKIDCVAKFQAISAAYEILTDKNLRNKYDLERKRAGAFPLTTASRPGSTAGRGNPYAATSAYPPPPRRTQAPPWTKPSSAQAQTGADRFTSFPRPSPTSRKDSEATNVFSAWQSMNAARQRESQQASKAQAQAQAAQKRAQASFRPVPPRPTVDPNYAANAANAASTAGSSQSGSATRNTPTAFAGYQTTSSSPSRQRQQSASRPSSAGPASATGQDFHRASFDATDEHSSGAFGARSTKTAKKTTFAPPPPPRPQSTDDAPFAEANRARTPYINVSGERTVLSGDPLRRTQSTRETTRVNGSNPSPPGPSSRNHSVSPLKRGSQGTSRDKPLEINTSSESSGPGSGSDPDSDSASHNSHTKSRRASPEDGGVPPSESEAHPVDPTRDSGAEAPSRTSIFSLPLNGDTFESPAARTGQANIDTSFTANDWSGTFTGVQDDHAFAAPARTPRPSSRRAQDGTIKRPSRLRVSAQRNNGPQTSTPSAFAINEQRRFISHLPKSAPLMSTFTPDVWQESAWDFTPSPSQPSSRNGTEGYTQSAQQPAPAHGSSGTTDRRASVGDGSPVDAMDVDPAPPLSTAASSLDVDREPRMYTVPLSGAPGSPRDGRRQSRAMNKVTAGSSAESSSVNLAGLEQSLNDSQSNGLEALKDMANGLPFVSKPSSQHPTKSFEAQAKSLPFIPKGPEAPLKMSLATWHAYCAAMSHYLTAFSLFNEKMLAHFQKSQDHEAQLARLGSPALEAVGQAGDVGLPSYVALLKEDERFRECWNIAQEKHAETVQTFVAVKEKVRRLREGPGLSTG